MRTFKDYIVKEDEFILKMNSLPDRKLNVNDPAMAYYIRRMAKQHKAFPRFKMREL